MEVQVADNVKILIESDIVRVRKTVRNAAEQLKFRVTDVTRVVTAASELARNIFRYAGTGEMDCKKIFENGKKGIELIFSDQGPGIEDVEQAMETGFTSAGGLGLGLPGTKRLMDEMEIESQVGKGTIITVRKWLRS